MANEAKYENLMDKSIGFEAFPNELLLNMLGFLGIVDLIKCSQTSKRVRVICYEKSLWQKINLSRKRVPTEFLQKVIDYGCKCLNLNRAKLIGTLRLENESQLNHLDLSRCRAENQSVLKELLNSCHSLQTLSFTKEVCNISQMTVQNGKTLQILNFLCGDQGLRWRLDLSSIECILKNCSALKELHFWNGIKMLDMDMDGNICYVCSIDNDAIDYLVNNISTQIEKFSLAFDPYLGEEKIETLVSRCTKLKELRLSCYTNIRNDSITHIIDHLKPTLEKLVIDCAGIGENDFRKLYELKSMSKLKNFDFTYREYSTPDKNVISELRYQLPNVSVNGHPPLESEEGKR
jgi:hypothetical protein